MRSIFAECPIFCVAKSGVLGCCNSFGRLAGCPKGLLVGGVKLPQALAELGLIDEYEFWVHPRLAGHWPTLFAGLSKRIDLRLASRVEFGSGGGDEL